MTGVIELLPQAALGGVIGYDADGIASRAIPDLARAPNRQILGKWRKAIANAHLGAAHSKVLFVGDSTDAGDYAANYMGTRPYAFYRELLAMGYPIIYNALIGRPTSGGDARVSAGAGWSGGILRAFGDTLVNSTTTNAYAFTPVDPIDTIETYYVSASGYGSMTIDVDGGAALDTINLAAANSVRKRPAVTTALGTHTINAKRVSGTVTLNGFDAYNSALKKIRVLNAGVSGAKTSDYAGALYGTPGIIAAAPDLTIVTLTINDTEAATALATYEAQLQTIVDAALISGDCVITSSMPTNGVSLATQKQYRDICLKVANANGLMFIDLLSAYASYAVNNALGLMADAFHSTSLGYTDSGRYIARCLAL